MKKITEELLLGEIEDVLWLREDSSINIFENNYTGAFFNSDNEDGLYFDWKINDNGCLLYTSPSPRDVEESRMPSSA